MLDRYSRQTLFAPIGKEGQERLAAASVTIIGCGALGTVLANNLCRAGIGHLVIADRSSICPQHCRQLSGRRTNGRSNFLRAAATCLLARQILLA